MAEKLIALAQVAGIPNPKFVLERLSDGMFWNEFIGGGFEVYSAISIGGYGIAGAETGATGMYTVTNPAGTTECKFYFVAAAGASLVVSDLLSNVYYEGTAGVAAGLLDLPNGVMTNRTVRQVLRLLSAVLGGKLSGAGTNNNVIRDLNDTKDVVSATVDSSGNRTAVTLDLT